ncbi:MAG: Shedu immune nuclease family protein [Patescibacteria group bacterium]
MADTSVVLVKETKTKKTYNIFYKGKDTNQIAMERSVSGLIKFYPFFYDERNRKLKRKYTNIIYIGTKTGKIPSSGLFKDTRGYGFTSAQGVNEYFKYVDKSEQVNGILFVDTKTRLKDKILYLSFKDYGKIHARAKNHSDGKKAEGLQQVKTTLHEILPDFYPEPDKLVHTQGNLNRYLSKYSVDHFFISAEEAERLNDILFSSGHTTEAIITTRNKIDKIYIEEVIKEYKELMKLKVNSEKLEERWQQFFKKHTWIFTYIFAFPAVYFDQKVNVGGRSFSGTSDKIVDFLYKNDLTNNLAFLEIKTHKTRLINSSPYRKPDIYSVSSDLTGAIIQVLDQRNNLMKNYHAKVGTAEINSLGSQCVVLAGSMKDLSLQAKKDSLELFRSGNREVTILTFDELLKKISNLLSIFTKASG